VFSLVFETYSGAFANPISEVSRDKAKADLKAELLDTYGSNYSTVEMLLTSGMADFETLIDIPDDPVYNGILTELKETYYPNFSTILMLYESNKKSYDNLNK
jgi:hypothetical protein